MIRKNWYRDYSERGKEYLLNCYAKRFGDYVNQVVAPVMAEAFDLSPEAEFSGSTVVSIELYKDGSVANLSPAQPMDDFEGPNDERLTSEALNLLGQLVSVPPPPTGTNESVKLYFRLNSDGLVDPAWRYIDRDFIEVFKGDNYSWLRDAFDSAYRELLLNIRMRTKFEFGLTLDIAGNIWQPALLRPVEIGMEDELVVRSLQDILSKKFSGAKSLPRQLEVIVSTGWRTVAPGFGVPLKAVHWKVKARSRRYVIRRSEKLAHRYAMEVNQSLESDSWDDQKRFWMVLSAAEQLIPFCPKKALELAKFATRLDSTGAVCNTLMGLYRLLPSSEILSQIIQQQSLRVRKADSETNANSYRIELARFFGSIGQYDRAVEEYLPVTDHANLSSMHFELAEGLRKKGDTSNALREYELALEVSRNRKYMVAMFDRYKCARRFAKLLRKAGNQSKADKILAQSRNQFEPS